MENEKIKEIIKKVLYENFFENKDKKNKFFKFDKEDCSEYFEKYINSFNFFELNQENYCLNYPESPILKKEISEEVYEKSEIIQFPKDKNEEDVNININ